MSNDARIQWSQQSELQHLTTDREGFWDPEQIAVIARTQLGLADGMTLVDVGCGSGYLGLLFGPYIRGGRYIGVDRDAELLRHAWYAISEAKRHRDEGRRLDLPQGFEGIEGDAYQLPLEDGVADVCCCHTLLIHLAEPARAVAEMVRVTKPGGVVTLIEPDNRTQHLYTDLDEQADAVDAIEDKLAIDELFLRTALGRARAGRGDWGIGPRTPALLRDAGLTSIRTRVNHETDLTVRDRDPGCGRDPHRFARQLIGWVKTPTERKQAYLDEQRELFIAAGGTPARFDDAIARLDAVQTRRYEAMEARGSDDVVALGFAPMYVTTGSKPA